MVHPHPSLPPSRGKGPSASMRGWSPPPPLTGELALSAAENPGGSRYRPPKISGVQITKISGNPKRRACTSYVERNNWTIRTHLRRFTRLSNGFSRKMDNMKAALALWFWYYNFCRIHGSTRVTPAMALGVTDRLWDLADIVA